MRPILTLIIMFSLFGCNKAKSQVKKVVELPLFGEISFNPTDYYVATAELNNRKIKLDLNFYSDEINNIDILDGTKLILNNLQKFDKKATAKIYSDFSENGTVYEYIEHHLLELKENQIKELLKSSDKTLTDKQNLLAKLKLHRIGFYPEDKKGFAVFDYTIGKGFTDYLIVIWVNKNGEIVGIGTES